MENKRTLSISRLSQLTRVLSIYVNSFHLITNIILLITPLCETSKNTEIQYTNKKIILFLNKSATMIKVLPFDFLGVSHRIQ